ncbi:MAG: hypothetical protein JJU00_06080 [Opitutales bacterium]|nr:hypothetical protein [Opitutales bacterium]
MPTRNLKSTVLTAAALLTASAAAQIQPGEVLAVNFTKDTNIAGDNWNNVSAPSGATIAEGILIDNLIRFGDGSASGVSLAIAGEGMGHPVENRFGIGGRDEPFDAGRAFPYSGAIPAEVQENLTFHVRTPQHFIFSGLDDSLTYDLSILSANTTDRNPHAWVAQPGPDEVSITVDPDDGMVHTFAGLSTDGAGRILLENTSDEGGGNAQHLNAIELAAVPAETRSWAGFPVEDGVADTGDWLGLLHVEHDPWIWSEDLWKWLYFPPADSAEDGAWGFFPQQ